MTKEELEKELDELEDTPLFDNIIIKEEVIEKSKGGIILAKDGENIAESMRATVGTVLAIGPAVSEVKIGDMVSYGLYAGKNMRLPCERGNKNLWVMNVHDLQTIKVTKGSGHIILTKDMYSKLTEGDGDDGSSE